MDYKELERIRELLWERDNTVRLTNTAQTPRGNKVDAVSACFKWRPQGDSNPCYRRERAVDE